MSKSQGLKGIDCLSLMMGFSQLFSGMESEAKNALFAIESECTLLKGVTKPYLSQK